MFMMVCLSIRSLEFQTKSFESSSKGMSMDILPLESSEPLCGTELIDQSLNNCSIHKGKLLCQTIFACRKYLIHY